jgi:hypothetical protein
MGEPRDLCRVHGKQPSYRPTDFDAGPTGGHHDPVPACRLELRWLSACTSWRGRRRVPTFAMGANSCAREDRLDDAISGQRRGQLLRAEAARREGKCDSGSSRGAPRAKVPAPERPPEAPAETRRKPFRPGENLVRSNPPELKINPTSKRRAED